ncbi:conserved hypothetical protein [Cellulomonas flavigena DSM 20109]|uniref:Uncharacterized protein n=1 Tax=Cellulomonas flavigena (strain ATCC 482 / DSM 20109 / BCRC 11376 / JCM 18109 / NBRC 3775 / NCIMB 8073 / NRS 134) TaxID=446466 RepID=D5UKA1_CELFN|nr:hypothetical protein [Cellulomonas flavigena]ADG75762.1 conserved hypothetical protein [Cellulomonas flavigena DSM 20109]
MAATAVRGLIAGPGGVVRVLGVLSVLVALVRSPVEVALFALVLAGLVVPLVARASRTLDTAYGVGLLVAAWSSALQLYQAVAWLDLAVHLVVTGLVAAVGHLLLARWTTAVVDPHAATSAADKVGAVVVTTSLGLALAVLWELGEYVGHTYLDPEIYVGYADTIGDLVAGGLGSAVAGLWLCRRRRSSAPAADEPAATHESGRTGDHSVHVRAQV